MHDAAPPATRLRAVIAPDSFKGSIAAERAAAALAAGWLGVRPGDEVRALPMADGGEGTLDTVAAAVPGARRVPVEVTGPDGRPVRTHWLRLPDGSALVELAACSGILLLGHEDPAAPHARAAHTLGTGQAIRAAIEAGARTVHVALGGSASSDGGSGILVGLGARLLDAEGGPLPPGNASLDRLAEVDLSGVPRLPPGGLVAWTDVTSPLLGPEGAVAVFGPQKGLRGAEAERAESALARFAGLLGGDPGLPGAGAAGGAGFALARLGARLVGGAAAVAETIGLEAALAGDDVSTRAVVVTGEGRFDAQSARGKVVSHVSGVARAHGVPAGLVAGVIEAEPRGFAAVLALAELAEPGEDPMRDAEALLRRAGAVLARRLAAAAGAGLR